VGRADATSIDAAVPRAAGAVAAAVAVLALVGWALGSATLTAFHPRLTPMNPATALALLLGGASLWLSAKPELRLAARSAAVVMASIGLVRLAGYLGGHGVAIDTLLFPGQLAAVPHGPNRMAPNTALNLLLLGLALCALHGETARGHGAAQHLAAAAGVVTLLVVTGYGYAATGLMRVASFVPMALNTALACGVLCVGVLFARPDRGPVAVLTSPRAGGNAARRLVVAALGIPWLLGWLCLWGERAGLYDAEFGVSLFAVSTMVVLATAVWWTARSLDRADAERQRADKVLEAQAAEIRDLYDRAPCGYHSLDAAGTFVRVNATELAWLGYTAEEVVGRMSFADLLSPAGKAAFVEHFAAFKERGTIGELEFELVRRDGSQLPVLLSATAIRDGEGRYVASRSILFDITHRKEAERELARLHAELEDRAAQLEAFSYSVSHDLRAPLRAIDGYARILVEDHADRLDAEARRVLGVICDNARHMGRLIDDLLTFSRLGRKEVEKSPVDMASLARSVVDELRLLEPDRRVAVTIGSLPPALADPAMIRQVLTNVVANAWKFTRGRAEATIEVTGAAGPRETTYRVRDNGAGFDMQYASKLFGVFQRLHRADQFEGTGVGLAIVHRIVQRHGGRVWAHGAVDRGATFTFTLPTEGGSVHGPRERRDTPGGGQPGRRRAHGAGAPEAEPG
jgi:PAS domain S-box-containing protein